LAPAQALSLSVTGAGAGLVLVWIGATGLALVGVVLVGLSLAPFFPSLVSITPRRLGGARTVGVMGYQLAAASVGVAVVPAVIGVVADRTSSAAIAPCLLAVGLGLALSHVVTALVAGDLTAPWGAAPVAR
jgi:fucose permease